MRYTNSPRIINSWKTLLRYTFLIIIVGAYSCKSDQSTNKQDSKNIYLDKREWTFKVYFKDALENVIDTCQLKLTVGKTSISSLLANQEGILYTYSGCNDSKSYKETTGVDESSNGIFLHPPRLGEFAFTEVVPFPRINYPVELQSSSEIELKVAKSAFKMAENKTFKHIIERTTTDTLQYKNTTILCYVVEGRNTNYIEEIGRYKATYWFNQKYGFVRLSYFKPDKSSIDIVLENTNF